jgi:hypothetical protein
MRSYTVPRRSASSQLISSPVYSSMKLRLRDESGAVRQH